MPCFQRESPSSVSVAVCCHFLFHFGIEALLISSFEQHFVHP